MLAIIQLRILSSCLVSKSITRQAMYVYCNNDVHSCDHCSCGKKNILHPWIQIASSPTPSFLFPFTSSFPVSLPFYCLLFLPFPFLYYLPISSPFPSLPPSPLFTFLPFLYHSATSPVPFYLGLVLTDYIPSLNFSVT